MRAILIDPFNRDITEIELSALKEVADVIGCLFVQSKDLGKHVAVYIDPDHQGFFKVKQSEALESGHFAYDGEVIGGRAVIIGGIGATYLVPCTLSVDEVLSNVAWTMPVVDDGELPWSVAGFAPNAISDRREG